MALPSVTALVGSETVKHSLVSGFLHFYIERGINLQPTFMNLIGAELTLQVAANLFYEVRGQRVRVVREPQCKRCGTSVVGLCGGDLAIFDHGVDHQIAALLRAIRMVDRRIV